MAKGKSDQTRQWARSMYLHENRTQQEIADAVGVTRQTVARWAKLDKWDEMKVSLTMTRETQIKNMYRQLSEINQAILGREDGKRFATSKEADTIAKLTDSIKKLETEIGIHDVVSVAERFIGWLRPIDVDQTKTFVDLFDKFIKSLL